MRRGMVVLGVCTAAGAFVWSCSSTVTTEGSGTTATGSGGKSGSGGMGGSAGGPVSSTMMSSSTGPMSLCEQACAKLDKQCGFGNICSQLKGVLDCSSNTADCPAKCILGADCGKIATILSANPDKDLQCCLQTCQTGNCDPCGTCAGSKCGKEVQACTADKTCAAFIGCAQPCNMDPKCVQDCYAKNHDAAVDTLVGCTNTNCAGQCVKVSAGTGAGGAGGAAGGAPPN